MLAQVAPDVQATLSALRTGLEGLYGERLKGLLLYGSQARGEATPESDIDVAVLLEGPVRSGEEIRRTSHLRAEINLESGYLVSCFYLTPEALRQEQRLLYRRIRQDGAAF